jgi:site-specific DNA-methyltransferase (adenine-specific)
MSGELNNAEPPYKRKEIIGSCALYLADFRTALPTLDSCNHCITDPPYEEEAHTKGRRLLGKQRNGNRTVEYGALDFAAITDDLRGAFCKEMARICSGWILAFCQAEAVGEWRDSLVDAGCKYRRSMIWRKPDGPPQFTGDRPGMGYESIVAAWAGEGRSIWNGGGKHGVFEHPQRDNNNPKKHMTQKPIRLMLELVSLFTNPGETVIDPFMGSGTTLVACAKSHRRGIGIEMEEGYFDIACQRVRDAYAQPDMFIPALQPHIQEAML